MKNSPLALVFHGLVVVFMLAPLVIVCLVAFTPADTLSVPWGTYSLRWFEAVFEHGDLVQSFWNSLVVALAAATVAVALAVPAGLAIARHEFPGRQALNALLMSPLIVPHLVLGVAMLRLFSLMGARGSSTWLTIAHVVVVTPYALRLIVAALAGLDRSIEQAALSLGASRATGTIELWGKPTEISNPRHALIGRDGIALVPDALVPDPGVEEGALVPVLPDLVGRQLGLRVVVPAVLAEIPRIKAMLELLKPILGEFGL